MNESARLTDAEVAFIASWVLEGFQPGAPDLPASSAFRMLGLSTEDFHKRYEFEYLWQEQARVDVYTATGDAITITPVSCPWPDAATFLRRWEEVLPEIMARGFEKDHAAEGGIAQTQGRAEVRGEAEVSPFTAAESEFLDALANEVRDRAYGPCLRALVARNVPHFEAMRLIGRRSGLSERNRYWPPPHRAASHCPWRDRRAFENRFLPR